MPAGFSGAEVRRILFNIKSMEFRISDAAKNEGFRLYCRMQKQTGLNSQYARRNAGLRGTCGAADCHRFIS
ncbi:hypothetical protein [Rariglobus hedericola]|uniref:Uncharacterized protein n=1 Tax=Rariglobus hedericola TaxID=2597822 RepID=A0A556QJA5_9BACT|nr:hypothetical protein [Rariglobus hedericola]TSJ76709.1 hypothetical protein FPL22_11320 [Rariglobus hedericola]